MKEKIDRELIVLYEEYDYYLMKQEEDPYNMFYEDRIKEIRIMIRVYKKVLDMLDE